MVAGYKSKSELPSTLCKATSPSPLRPSTTHPQSPELLLSCISSSPPSPSLSSGSLHPRWPTRVPSPTASARQVRCIRAGPVHRLHTTTILAHCAPCSMIRLQHSRRGLLRGCRLYLRDRDGGHGCARRHPCVQRCPGGVFLHLRDRRPVRADPVRNRLLARVRGGTAYPTRWAVRSPRMLDSDLTKALPVFFKLRESC